MSVRKCWNIKSRAHPDVPCTRSVFFDGGDYCSLHYKNPRPFKKPCLLSLLRPKQIARLRRFFQRCKLKCGLLMASRQGFASANPSIANNPTELVSMDSVETIPIYLRFSFVEHSNHWLFDIRSLMAERRRIMESRTPFKNPYTSIPFEPDVLERIQRSIAWLYARRYQLSQEMSLEHATYEQKLVELCFLIDSHGYLTNLHWFMNLNLANVRQFIDGLNIMWHHALGLTHEERLAIVPGWNATTVNLITPITTTSVAKALDTLAITLLALLKAAPNRDSRGLMAVYIITALTTVSPGARRAFPWID